MLDLTTGTDHSNINIDEIEFTLGGNFVYVAIDNFTFDANFFEEWHSFIMKRRDSFF